MLQSLVPSSPASDRAERHAMLRTLLPRKPKWPPDPEALTGEQIGIASGKTCWKVRDPGQKPFPEIYADVQHLLNEAGPCLPGCLVVGFHVYMIGDAREKSIPYIMFHCRKKGPRTAAKRLVEKSSLLKKHHGLLVGHWPEPPHLPKLESTNGTGDKQTEIYSTEEFALTLTTSDSIASKDGVSILWNYQPLGLLVKKDTPHQFPGSSATVSLLVAYGGQDCFLAPAHAFIHIEDAPSKHEDDDDEVVFGTFDEAADDDEEPSDLMDLWSKTISEGDSEASDRRFQVRRAALDDSISLPSSDTPDVQSAPITNSLWRTPGSSNLAVLSTSSFDSICSLISTDLDFVLIPCPPELSPPETGVFGYLSRLGLAPVEPIKEGFVRVSMRTSDGCLLQGTLDGFPTYMRLPRASQFRRLYAVQLDTTEQSGRNQIKKGDSGAIVRDQVTNRIYGHVVVASIDTSVAFIIPVTEVISHVQHMSQHLHRNAEKRAAPVSPESSRKRMLTPESEDES